MTTLSSWYAPRAGSRRPGPVRLSGTLSADAGVALLDWLQSRCRDEAPDVVVDLSAVTKVDRDGAEALFDACVATTLRSGTLTLTGVTERCRAALEAFGVLAVVDLVDVSAPGDVDPPDRRHD